MGTPPQGSYYRSRHLETSDDPIQILRDVRELCPEEEHLYGRGMATFLSIIGSCYQKRLLGHVRYGAQEARARAARAARQA